MLIITHKILHSIFSCDLYIYFLISIVFLASIISIFIKEIEKLQENQNKQDKIYFQLYLSLNNNIIRFCKKVDDLKKNETFNSCKKNN